MTPEQEQQERAAFEADWADNGGPQRMHKSYPPEYVEAAEKDAAWQGWQARAQMAQAAPAGELVTVPRERTCIVTIWNRQFDVVPYYRANGFKVLPEALTLNGFQIKTIGGVPGDRILIRQADQKVIGETETIIVQPGDDFDAIPPAFSRGVHARTTPPAAPTQPAQPTTGNILKDAYNAMVEKKQAAQPAEARPVVGFGKIVGTHGRVERWPELPDSQPAEAWKCFHCGETFTDEDAAREHFGASERQNPACTINIAEYRRMEEAHRRQCQEDTEWHRAYYRLGSEHVQKMRQHGDAEYARGLRDGVNLPADSPERAALAAQAAQPAMPSRAERMRAAGYTRRPTLRELPSDDAPQPAEAQEPAPLDDKFRWPSWSLLPHEKEKHNITAAKGAQP